MSRRDDDARRGSRGKRPSGTLPPQPASRMEMMLAAAAASAAEPPAVTHYQTYPPPPPPPPPPVYHSHAYPPMQQQLQPSPAVIVDAAAVTAAKRKRVKKSDDEWASSAPTVASSMSISSLVAPPPPPAFAMPVASSSAASLSSILSAASPIPSAPSPTVSVFQAPPAPIQSFADTERQRRSVANGVATVNSSSNVSAVNTVVLGSSKNSNNNNSSSRKSDARTNTSSSTQLSMLDLFFPDTAASSSIASKSSASAAAADANGASKSLKRKRRGESAVTSSTSSSAAASVEIDMLRFGVDSTKLVPQGIVDRIDAKMDRTIAAKLIESHVANWLQRAGFSATFLADATTLLTAYYPCHYATLLDDVLACFLFKRPEFIDLLLTPMIEKLQKLGESATGSKYPLIDALARTCVPTTSPTERKRHDFSCVTLLQTLLARNTDRFVLSPAIAACALHCSDTVIATLWRELLRAWLADTTDRIDDASAAQHASPRKRSKPVAGSFWHIVDPEQQAFELLGEEKKLRARGDVPLLVGSSAPLLGHAVASSRCRLTRALVQLVLRDRGDDDMAVGIQQQQQLLASPLVQHAVALVLGHSSAVDSAMLLRDCLSHRHCSASREEQFAQLLSVLVASTATTTRSVPTSNWFSRHVLRFVLASDSIGGGDSERDVGDDSDDACRKRLFTLVVTQYMPLILGAPDHNDSDDECGNDIQPTDSTTLTTTESTKVAAAPAVSWDALASTDKLSASGLVERLDQLLELLASVPLHRAVAFLDVWTTAWSSCAAAAVVVPWPYVDALVRVAIADAMRAQPHAVAIAFESLVAQTCRAQFRSVCSRAAAAIAARRVSDLVPLLLAATPSAIAQTLLHDAVDALRLLAGGAALFRNAVLVSLSDAPRINASMTTATVATSATATVPTKAASGSTGRDALPPRRDVAPHVLASLQRVASSDDAVGRFVRVQLSSRPAVRLLTALLRDVALHQAAMTQLLALLEVVVGVLARRPRQRDASSSSVDDGDDSNAVGTEWLRQHVVQQLVASTYSADTLSTADRLVALLQALAQRSSNSSSTGSHATLLWTTLRECTRRCCGCGSRTLSPTRIHAPTTAVAATFAELVHVLLLRARSPSSDASSSTTMLTNRVAAFAQQELPSCRASAAPLQLNRFVLLLLPKLASSSMRSAVPSPLPRASLAAAQLAVSALGATARDDIRLLQLQLLETLCRGVRDCRNASVRVQYMQLVSNERLQTDLRCIVNAEGGGASSSRASVVLAQSVLQFATSLQKQQQQQALASR